MMMDILPLGQRPVPTPARRRARGRAWVYGVLSAILVVGPLLFLLMLLVGQAIS